MKIKKTLLQVFSVAMGFYFLNISINLYSFFGIQVQGVNNSIPAMDNDHAEYFVQADTDLGNSPAENTTTASNNPPAEEEEEKKAAHDDFFTLHSKHTKDADETYFQRFHGVDFSMEFISEIIPPPPKA